MGPLANHLSIISNQRSYDYPYRNYISAFSTYRKDDYNDNFVPYCNSMRK